MIRIREESGNYTLTFKHKLSDKGGYFESEEIEEQISPEIFGLFCMGDPRIWTMGLKPLEKAKTVMRGLALSLIGSTVTERRYYRLSNGDTACLDRTFFQDNSTDFEIEIETDDPQVSRAGIKELINNADISMEVQTNTKYMRFIEKNQPKKLERGSESSS